MREARAATLAPTPEGCPFPITVCWIAAASRRSPTNVRSRDGHLHLGAELPETRDDGAKQLNVGRVVDIDPGLHATCTASRESKAAGSAASKRAATAMASAIHAWTHLV